MRSYAIAVMMQPDFSKPTLLEELQSLRTALPFAQFFLYGTTQEDGQRLAIQKMDMTLRADDSGNRFTVARRMFTETDADIFVYLADSGFDAQQVQSMIHQLVEGRKDMVATVGSSLSRSAQECRDMCERLYGRRLINPLSGFRVFSRRYVKSFSAFERGFPIELEWSIHALELDVPYAELSTEDARAQEHSYPVGEAMCGMFTRLVLNLQARPLKWFGMLTGAFLVATLVYKTLFLMDYFGYEVPVDEHVCAIAAASFAVMGFVSAMSGLLLHSHSHTRREIKRLHFQQHSTL